MKKAALTKLKQGEVHLALVTDAMLGQLPAGINYVELGELKMQVAVGRTHPLASGANGSTVSITSDLLLPHPFATPHVSPFCGEVRGLGCDGWKDQLVPRKTGWVVNDYAVLSQLVKSGQAVAYLPDFLLREWGLVRVDVEDYGYDFSERVLLVFRTSGPDWTTQTITALQ